VKSEFAVCEESATEARARLSEMKIPYSVDSFGECALKGDLEAVGLFLKSGMSVDAKDSKSFTALMISAWHGQTEVVKLLLDRGADMNARIETGAVKGATALILAAGLGHTEVVKLLLDKGADMNVRSAKGRTVLMYAAIGHAESGHGDVVKLLLDKGVDITPKDNLGRRARDYSDDPEVKALLEARPNK
jgi:uncharacterized protein